MTNPTTTRAPTGRDRAADEDPPAKGAGFLQKALRGNATFSIVSVAAMAVAGDWISRQLGLPGPGALVGLEVALLLFAGSLLWEARKNPPKRQAVVAFTAMDALWVVGSAVVLVVWGGAMTPAGWAMVAGVAVVVGVFAALQLHGLSRQRRDGAG